MNNGPMCKCGSRRTTRVGDSALLRQCYYCGETKAYRVHMGRIVPLSPIVALTMDEWRETDPTWFKRKVVA